MTADDTDPRTTAIHERSSARVLGPADGGIELDIGVDVDGVNGPFEIESSTMVGSSLTGSPPVPPGSGGERRLPVSDVERRMRSDGYGKHVDDEEGSACDPDKRRIVCFLYGRELGKDLPREQRHEKIQRFIATADTIAQMNANLPFVGSASGLLRLRNNDGGVQEENNCRLWRTMHELALRYEAYYNSSPPCCCGTIFERLCCCIVAVRAHKNGSRCTTIFRGGIIPYIQCLQASDQPCYIAAPITLMNYLLMDATASAPTGHVVGPVVDVRRYIRHRYSNEGLLEGRVVANAGGSSISVLHDLVGSSSDEDFEFVGFVRACRSDDDDDEDRARVVREVSWYVVRLLTRYGAALVSRFDMTAIRQLRRDNPDPADASSVVYMPSFDVVGGEDAIRYTQLGMYNDDPNIRAVVDGFERSANEEDPGANDVDGDESNNVAGASASSASTLPSQPVVVVVPAVVHEGATTQPPAYHAMVLIGSRFDKKKAKKKHWFLLQNSWRSLPLLEVSDAFLARHLEGRLVFVRRTIAAADLGPGLLSPHGRLYQECGFDDGGDTRTGPLEDDDNSGNRRCASSS
jgi:hypothetical protein